MHLLVALMLAITLPPANVDLDYQLGGVRRPDTNVQVVVRDRASGGSTPGWPSYSATGT